MYLEKEQRVALGEFLAGGLWQSVKQALEQRRPPFGEASDSPSTAAHLGFERKGFEACVEAIQKLAVESAPTQAELFPPSLGDTRD